MMKFDITLPVLNEEECLEENTRRILEFFDQHDLHDWTLTITDNGSTDSTSEISRKLVKAHPGRVSYLRLEQRGVGLAVRSSWSQSDADIVGYMDIDLATDLNHLLQVRDHFKDPACRVVNGSRFLNESCVENRKAIRKVTSFVLNEMMHTLLGNSFSDAMCGFKFFERQHVLKMLRDVPDIPDWFVCSELLIRSEWAGEVVYEIPVHWTDDPNSKAKIAKLAKQYTGHILRLRREKNKKRKGENYGLQGIV
jgi:glycosyltransferase involved in cell wall biosynthesis